jgi:hypothetical protein
MTRDQIIERLIEIGFTEETKGLRAEDGSPAQGFRHSSLTGEKASVYVSDNRIRANGLYRDQLSAVPTSGHNFKGNPFWEGEALEAALKCLEGRYLSKGVSDLLRAFDALSPAEQHQVATIILRRSAGSGEIPDEAFNELAADLFRTFDAEEAADVDPLPG